MQIYFIVYKPTTSTYASSFVKQASKLGFPFKVHNRKKQPIENIKNSIVVLVKWLHEEEVRLLKGNNNIIVHDLHDWWKTCDRSAYPVDLLDGSIVATKTIQEDLNKRYADHPVAHIYHPADLAHQKAQQEQFKVGFIGQPRYNLTFKQELKQAFNIGIVRCDFARSSHLYNCHLNLRPNYKIKGYFTPNSKVATAAACGTNLVSFPETNALDLLPSDYPYFVEEKWEEVKEGIEQARRDFEANNSKWKYGLEVMRFLLHNQLSTQEIGSKYLDFLNSLSPGQ